MSITPVVPSLATLCVLVDLDIAAWSPYVTDERADDAVRSAFANERDTGTYRKKLLPVSCPEWQAISKARGVIERTHRFYTQPWQRGIRIMPAAMFHEYEMALKPWRAKFAEAVDAFCDPATYERIVAESLARQGGLARRDDYPDTHAIRAKFRVAIKYEALSESSDFRVALDAKARKELMRSRDEAIAEAVQTARDDSWQRLLQTVDAMRGSVLKYDRTVAERTDDGEGRRAVLKEATFDNLRRAVDVLRKLNVMGDDDLASMVDQVEACFGALDAESLRDDYAKRGAVIRQADAIADQMAAFMGGR